MSVTVPVKNIIVTNPATGEDEIRRIGSIADDVEGLGTFLGMAVDGESGPITRYEDGYAYEILIPDVSSKYYIDKNSFKGYIYKLGGTYLGALIKSISITEPAGTPSILEIPMAGLSEKNTTSNYGINTGRTRTILCKAYDGQQQEITGAVVQLEMNESNYLSVKAIIPSGTQYPIKIINEKWFWIKSCDNKFLAENDFSDEYKNKIDNLDASDVLLDKNHPSAGTVESEFGVIIKDIADINNIITIKDFTIDKDYVDDDSIPINKACLMRLDDETGYAYQEIKGKAYYFAGRLLRLDILKIGIYHGVYGSSTQENLEIVPTSTPTIKRLFRLPAIFKTKYSNPLDMRQENMPILLTRYTTNSSSETKYYSLQGDFELGSNVLSYIQEVDSTESVDPHYDDYKFFEFGYNSDYKKPIISFFW